jgi:hypothetical protein
VSYFPRSDVLLVEESDRQAASLGAGERDRLGYWVLIRLHGTAANGDPVKYADLLPEVDDFELRAAASWLVVSGYARWAGALGISITEHGRQAVGTIQDLTRTDSTRRG